MEHTPTQYLSILVEEFQKRQKANSRYSLRAFARQLDLDPSALSRILRGRQPLSIKAAKQIIERLKLPAPKAELLLQEVVRSIQQRIQQSAAVNLDSASQTIAELQLNPEQLSRLMNFLNSMKGEGTASGDATVGRSIKLITEERQAPSEEPST